MKVQLEPVLTALRVQHTVPDIVLPTSTCIFILESPHVQELKYGAPVAGSSGLTMSRHLFGDRYGRFPLGLLVKQNAGEQTNRPRLNRIGLLNVSNVPLQRTAYHDPAVVSAHAGWLHAMEHVRANNQTDTYRDMAQMAVQDALATALRTKLEALRQRTCTLIPCGRFAQKFFRLAAVQSSNWTVIHDVPHPSYNSWDRAQYAGVIGRVQHALDAASGDVPDA